MNPDLPFTRDQFMEMFGAYNQAIWPVQVLAYVLGALALVVVVKRWSRSDQAVGGILGAFWLWMAVLFTWTAMRTIDHGPGPVLFTAAFAFEGILLLRAGPVRRELQFGTEAGLRSGFGWVLIVYAMLVYPLLSVVNGHVYPHQPLFGVAPCPTAIFTFGLLLLTTARVPKMLLVVPFLWSVTSGVSAPLNYGMYEDLALPIAGILATGLLIWRDWRWSPGPALEPLPPCS